jgi:phospholipid/cholesterol/gamma-HCH transport system substrate-binding protein
MKSKTEQDIKVGIFVSIGMAFAMVAILVLGGSESIFRPKTSYRARFANTTGLLPGAKVVLSGINVGSVKDVDYDGNTRMVVIRFSVDTRFSKDVREGSTVEIMTQGVLGDKYVSLTPGAGEKILPEDTEIQNITSKDLSQLLTKSDLLLVNAASAAGSLDRLLRSLEKAGRLDSIMEDLSAASKNLSRVSSDLDGKDVKKITKNLAQILEKVNQGNGTVGALINDPSLYEDVRSVVGGANRNRILRNLVRKTAKDGEK